MANILIGHVKGPKGDAATVSVGTTTTGAAGSSASVTNSGTSSAAVLNFTIPKGDKGDAGTPGVTDYATSSAAGLVRVGSDFNINSSNGTLSIDKTALLEDGLTSTSTSKALTAKQGKALNDAKLAKTSVVNNLTTTESGYALDAREGKALNDKIEAKMSGVAMARFTPASGSTTSDIFTTPAGGHRHILFSIDSNANNCGAWFIFSNNSNTIAYKEIVSASGMTLSRSGAALTFAHNAGSIMYMDITLSYGGAFLEYTYS